MQGQHSEFIVHKEEEEKNKNKTKNALDWMEIFSMYWPSAIVYIYIYFFVIQFIVLITSCILNETLRVKMSYIASEKSYKLSCIYSSFKKPLFFKDSFIKTGQFQIERFKWNRLFSVLNENFDERKKKESIAPFQVITCLLYLMDFFKISTLKHSTEVKWHILLRIWS